jgi:molecular chaperone GrpE
LFMGKANGRSEAEKSTLDLERELPTGDSNDGPETSRSAVSAASLGSETDLEKLKAERDSLLDRLARQQAEFDNARKRTVREQQEFREYAAADALKSLLPVVDSLDRALQVRSDTE